MTTKTRTKKVLSMLLSLVMMVSLCSVFCTTAFAVESDGEWNYTVDNGKATIISYSGTNTSITVPSSVGGYTVSAITGLCNNAYKSKITNITFSAGLTTLGNSVCSNYTSLAQVVIPNGVTTIGDSAFANCSSLQGITLPSSVTSIGAYAFQSCTSLTSANLACKVATIPESCFAGCTLLGNVTLPINLTAIGNNAFSDCKTLGTINMPNSIKSIGDHAFYNCEKLGGTLVIPEETKDIGEFAFAGCKSLAKVIIPNKTKSIYSEAFKDCYALTDVYVGNGVTKMESNIFSGCGSLSKVVFGGSYTNLKNTFDLAHTPTVYYPSSYSNTWSSYNVGPKKAYIASTSISITGNKQITVNDTLKLNITITPNMSAVGNIYYIKSSAPAIATVDQNGVVTAKAGGIATITVTTINGTTNTVNVKVAPKQITGVSAAPVTTGSVQVKWTAADNVTGYYVYRSTTKASGYKKIATVSTNSYTDKGLTKGSTYYYKVRAYVKSNSTTIQSDSSAAAKVQVSSPAPSTISVKKTKSKTAKITWTKAVGAEGYQVAMASSKNGTYKSIKTVTNGTTLTFTKTGLTAGKTYYFKVRSYITVNGTKVYSPFTKIVSCKV